MDSPSFDRWLNYHKGAYPGLGAWLKTNNDQLDHWERTLRNIGYEEAVKATDKLVEGDDQPKGYGEHPRWVRRLALSTSHEFTGHIYSDGPVVSGDQLVASCVRCMDYGMISVVSPKTLREVAAGREVPATYSCAVGCTCQRGQRFRGKLPTWSDQHFLIRVDDVLDMEATQHCSTRSAIVALAQKCHVQGQPFRELQDW